MNTFHGHGLLTQCDAVPGVLENRTKFEACDPYSMELGIPFGERPSDKGSLLDISRFKGNWETTDDTANGEGEAASRTSPTTKMSLRRDEIPADFSPSTSCYYDPANNAEHNQWLQVSLMDVDHRDIVTLALDATIMVGLGYVWSPNNKSDKITSTELPSFRYSVAKRLSSERRRERREVTDGVGFAGFLFAIVGWAIVLSSL